MTQRLPVCTGRDVIRALQLAGFKVIRIKGSHHVMRHDGPPTRSVTVPVHGKTALKRGTLAAIIRQAGMTIEAFAALLP